MGCGTWQSCHRYPLPAVVAVAAAAAAAAAVTFVAAAVVGEDVDGVDAVR